MRHSAKS